MPKKLCADLENGFFQYGVDAKAQGNMGERKSDDKKAGIEKFD